MISYKVLLKQSRGGLQFSDEVRASSINQARTIAECRNPGSKVLSVRKI